MRYFWGALLCLLTLAGISPATPAPPPPTPGPIQTPTPAATDRDKPELPLSLEDCLEQALASNLDLSIERINPLEARANVLVAQGDFDPVLKIDGSYGENRDPVFGDPDFTFDRSTSVSSTLSQTLASGTVVGLTANNNGSSNTGNDFYEPVQSFAGATFSQPLLQNFGTDVNLAAVRIARHDVTGSDYTLEYQVDQTITDVADAYYELIYARANRDAQKESLELAEQLLADNRARVQIGVMSPLDVSQANAEVAARRGDVLTAERTIQNDENTLRLLIAKDVAPLLNRRLVPTDLPPDDWDPQPVPPDINIALEQRADLRQARELLEHNQLAEAYRKNQLLPSLGLTGSYGYSGLSGDAVHSTEDVFALRDQAWSVGVAFQIPLGNRSERGQYETARYETERQDLILKQLEQEVIVQTDNAGGQTETNRQRITVARVARQLAEEALRDEEEKLKAGVSTSYTVLQLQRDLRAARIVELRAIADFQESAAELVRVEGEARAHYHIELRGSAY